MKKRKELFSKMKEKCRSIKQRFCNFTERNWKNTGKLLYWIAILLFSISTGVMTGTFMKPAWVGSLLVSVITFGITILAFWLAKKIAKLVLRNDITEFLSWLLLCLVCVDVMTGETGAAGETESTVFAILFSLVLALFLKSIWALFHHKVHTKTIFITLFLTGVPVIAVVALLCIGGFSDTYIAAYQKLTTVENLTEQEKVDIEKDMENGPYTVKTVTYGTSGEEDVLSATADISRFAQNDGISGFLKEQYQGYSMKEVPMAGIIWYPEERENCPTLFMIHGNHDWITDSYMGYEYLGTYLASHGYVVVSVDENACNGLSGENDGRAVLLLENMRQVEQFNEQKENLLYGKMDYENLALAGHSRGGEAIAEAYLFNELSYYPDNGNRTFSWNFSIKSLIAIAPVEGQYQPADREVELTDVNYLLIHGANDQDVDTFMGMRQYENISFTGKKDCIKSSLYVAGLNHGQFNSLWGKYDSSEPINRILNVENFLSQEEQQQIAKIFVKTFLDKTLENKENSNTELLVDCQKYQEILPQTLYVQSYATSDAVTLCNFEEDVRLETGSLEGVKIRAKSVNGWREEELDFSSGSSRENYAVVLKWEDQQGEPQIIFSLPEAEWNSNSLRFDIMNLEEDFEAEEAQLLEVEVIVTDAEGKKASVKAEDYVAVYPAFPVRLNKLQYLFGSAEYKHQFQTVSIPFTDFEGIDVTRITDITLQFSQKSGNVAIDNVKLSQY
ncbi:alpha/beta hydrolase family protein [Roseburia sp. 499]|uniref:alpha/beta hydrolase family protein n=1 Tax=Roseburia sp. 499 TaxID=1261634 RepID=UPI000951D724|nr:hypothetical protein [Roseburia sp. 499]WVK70729.1 chlorophyllase [Roseburia sp. 499]